MSAPDYAGLAERLDAMPDGHDEHGYPGVHVTHALVDDMQAALRHAAQEREALEVQLDARVGCVAVYVGPKRNCLDGIEADEGCLFFRRGHWDDRRREWTVPADVLAEARRLHTRLRAALGTQGKGAGQ